MKLHNYAHTHILSIRLNRRTTLNANTEILTAQARLQPTAESIDILKSGLVKLMR